MPNSILPSPIKKTPRLLQVLRSLFIINASQVQLEKSTFPKFHLFTIIDIKLKIHIQS